MRVACVASQGTGSQDESRILALCQALDPTLLPFDKSNKVRSGAALFARICIARPDLVVLEGTGVAAGAAVLCARWLRGIRYVLSSGDAVAPFIAARAPIARPVAVLYERALCRSSDGFVGWTPYLVGRALTFGAPRAMTAANWAPPAAAGWDPREARSRVRAELGIPATTTVFGLVGSLHWTNRFKYTYGLELIDAARRLPASAPIVVMVVGDGDGLARLRDAAAGLPPGRVILTGRVDRAAVPDYMSAMDIASLPQSADGVGAFRYTTKLSEYLQARLPVVTGQLPYAYDLGEGWAWRLPGDAPWDPVYIRALACLMETLDAAALHAARTRMPAVESTPFQADRQLAAFRAFIDDVFARMAR